MGAPTLVGLYSIDAIGIMVYSVLKFVYINCQNINNKMVTICTSIEQHLTVLSGDCFEHTKSYLTQSKLILDVGGERGRIPCYGLKLDYDCGGK